MKTLFILLTAFLSLPGFAQDQLMINGQPCGMNGSSKQGSKEYDQNAFKNRYNLPNPSDFDKTVTLAKLISKSATRDKFSQNKAVEVTGYVFNVKYGSAENLQLHVEGSVIQGYAYRIGPR